MQIIISTRAEQAAADITPDQRALVRRWTDFCQDNALRRAALYVDYQRTRTVSRWKDEPRSRPFVVRRASDLEIISTSKTLTGALRIAQELATTA